jgi:outer membrane protein TolC
MNLPPEDWDRPIVPTDDVDYRAVPIDLQSAVAIALQRRPVLREDELREENLRINYLFARNQRLPQLDLNLDYGLAGIGGRVLDPSTGNPDPDVQQTGFGDALQNIFERDFPRWTVGLTFGMPITNIGARAAARQAELAIEQFRQIRAQNRQDITVEVRTAVRNVETGARAIVAARTAREAAERNVEAERRRYENGMTTNFQVLQIQQQLSDARRSELLAIIGYNQAIASYEAATGTNLESHNITAEEIPVAEDPNMLPFFNRYNWLNYGSRLPKEDQPTSEEKK